MLNLTLHKKVALDAIAKSQEKILYYFHHLPKVETKVDKTPVTIADKEAEEIIIDTIKKTFPDHGFIGEEFGINNDKAEFVWLIDPIDGTKNFIHGINFFGTIIGLKYQGEIVLGASNMPAINELLFASESEATTLNGSPVRVSQISSLSDAYVIFSPSQLKDQESLNIYHSLLNNPVHALRGFGDCYGYHLVATGRVDVYFEIYPKDWDISAYKIIIKQAGGRHSDFNGNDLSLGGTSLATNGLLHQPMLSLIQLSYPTIVNS